MELQPIIDGLNKKDYALTIGVGSLNATGLTEDEKTFIKAYTPDTTLIIYGSLAPNKPNHSVVEHIKGNWQQGIVKGKLHNEGWGAELGYYGYRPARIDEQEAINVFVLFSDELVVNWPFLDEFEGSGYRRMLAQFELESGTIGVGNIYALNEAD